MSDAPKILPEVREQLWANLKPHFSRGVEAVLGARGRALKEETIVELLKLAYQSGLDRGYDMGYAVFGDGE